MAKKNNGCDYTIPRLVASLEAAPVGDGDLIGQRFRCLPYQRKFLAGAFKPGILRAGLSLARGGGKSGLASALGLDSIRPGGVLHRVGGETVVVASSFAQARIIFEAVKTSLELLGEDKEFRIRDQQNLADIQHKETKARLRVAGSDNRRAHGWRFNLAIVDEPAQHGPRGESLAAAIRTGLGKRQDAKVLYIGTRPSSDAHFFARLLDEDDESIFSLTYAAEDDDNPFAVSTWRKANPGMRYGMPDIEVLRAEARMAKRDPAELATFRSLRLNQGTSEVESQHLIDSLVWRSIETEELPPREGPMCMGLDLGYTSAFSACAVYWPQSHRLEGFVACGHNPPLSERALADGVSGVYETMLARNELVQIDDRVVPIGPFLQEAVRRYGKPQAIAADRYRDGELEDAVRNERLRLPEPTWRGQGYKDGGVDVRAFRVAVLTDKVAAPVSMAMRAALAEAKTVTDMSSNEKLAKSGEGQHRRRGRDDLAAAIILAIAEGSRREADTPKTRPRYRGRI